MGKEGNFRPSPRQPCNVYLKGIFLVRVLKQVKNDACVFKNQFCRCNTENTKISRDVFT